MQYYFHWLHHRLFRWSLAVIWLIVLTILLLQPEEQAVTASIIAPAPPSITREILFTSLHLLTFALTALIASFAIQPQHKSLRTWIVLILVLIAYGATIETIQMSVPGRSAQWWDMLANGLGILMGCSIWHAATNYWEQWRHNNDSIVFWVNPDML